VTHPTAVSLRSAAPVLVVQDVLQDLDGNQLCFGMESKPAQTVPSTRTRLSEYAALTDERL
jgi:hypothetical protein